MGLYLFFFLNYVIIWFDFSDINMWIQVFTIPKTYGIFDMDFNLFVLLM